MAIQLDIVNDSPDTTTIHISRGRSSWAVRLILALIICFFLIEIFFVAKTSTHRFLFRTLLIGTSSMFYFWRKIGSFRMKKIVLTPETISVDARIINVSDVTVCHAVQGSDFKESHGGLFSKLRQTGFSYSI